MGCRDGLCEGNTGAVLCETLPTPTDPPWDAAEPFSLVVIMGKTYLRRKRCTVVSSEENNNTVSTKLREVGEKMLQDLEQYFHVAHGKDHIREGKCEGTAAHGEEPKTEQVYLEGLQPIEWTHTREGKWMRRRKKV